MLSTNLSWIKKDDYTTPKDAWEDILQYIPKHEKLWLPFYNDGECETIVKSLGYENVEHYKKDFYSYDIHDALVIDNPPYSCKKEVIEKLKMRGIPFALLLPLHTLERNYVYGDKDMQVIIKKGKYVFREGNMRPPFKACWFCWGFQAYLKSEDYIIWI